MDSNNLFILAVLANYFIGVVFSMLSFAFSDERLTWKTFLYSLVVGQMGLSLVIIVLFNIDME